MEDNTPPSDEHEDLSPRSAAALHALEERARVALSARRGQISQLEEQITKQIEAITSAIGELRTAETEGLNQASAAREEVERLRQETEAARAAWQLEKSQTEAQFVELRAELEAQKSLQQAKDAELAQLRDELDARQTELHRHEAVLADREAALAAKSAASTAESAADRTALERERDELQQKFELALQDVQRFRSRAADLEQELARRPEASQSDSPELVALRAERDALAERVEQLQQQPTAQADADSEQEIADLRRRFEMAVEDVRELKTKNAELEARLAANSQRAIPASDSGAMDWESQKRRLLASLQDSTEDADDPLPENERISIQNTIDMTDEVVAGKDREIERLKSELAAASTNARESQTQKQDDQLKELLDADAVIAQHRERIGQLERDMQEKLRAAELELSVERAKLARQKAELEALRTDLESRRQSLGSVSQGAASAGAPRRRWLSKLGLSGEEQ